MAFGVRERVKENSKPKPTRYFSEKQERQVARNLNGKKTANSGATMFGGKSDVNVHNLFSIECKTKTSKSESISIKKSWLEKNKSESISDGHKYCALAFNFGPDEENHYIIDEDLFKTLIYYLENYNEDIE